jgi:hypothetical protein
VWVCVVNDLVVELNTFLHHCLTPSWVSLVLLLLLSELADVVKIGGCTSFPITCELMDSNHGLV